MTFIYPGRAKMRRGLEEPQDQVASGHRRRVLRYEFVTATRSGEINLPLQAYGDLKSPLHL